MDCRIKCLDHLKCLKSASHIVSTQYLLAIISEVYRGLQYLIKTTDKFFHPYYIPSPGCLLSAPTSPKTILSSSSVRQNSGRAGRLPENLEHFPQHLLHLKAFLGWVNGWPSGYGGSGGEGGRELKACV